MLFMSVHDWVSVVAVNLYEVGMASHQSDSPHIDPITSTSLSSMSSCRILGFFSTNHKNNSFFKKNVSLISFYSANLWKLKITRITKNSTKIPWH